MWIHRNTSVLSDLDYLLSLMMSGDTKIRLSLWGIHRFFFARLAKREWHHPRAFEMARKKTFLLQKPVHSRLSEGGEQGHTAWPTPMPTCPEKWSPRESCSRGIVNTAGVLIIPGVRGHVRGPRVRSNQYRSALLVGRDRPPAPTEGKRMKSSILESPRLYKHHHHS